MGLAAGTHLGPYEIVAPLGAGGMGEVYRARDARLGRDVAIKVLPDDVAGDPRALARFESEARAVAALSHPNILALFDVGEAEGVHYAVTELLEGETLREALREGPLPPRKSVDFGAQIADGLAAAHAKGIVHRDLKPENLFVIRDGRVKILDFGLARRLAIPSSVETSSPTEARATTPGEVLGTVGYLAPEQVRGLPADARTDIFAFGCVLSEMLSGTRAFKRETAAETMTAVLREEPPPLSVSPELSAIVFRCLEKKPEARFQSAQDLAFALRSLTSAPGPPPARVPVTTRRPALSWLIPGAVAFVLVAVFIGWYRGRGPSAPPGTALNPKRILVLPFENVTGDGSLDPVGRMAADWISQGLLQTGNVEVVTLGVGPGAGGAKIHEDPKALAASNRAGTVISGAYYAHGADLEFQSRLTDAASGKALFAAEPVRGGRDDPMKSVDRVRQRIMGAVVTLFSLPEVAAVIQKPPLYEAYVEYLAGFELIGFDNPKCLEHLKRAVELDPGFVVARIRLAAVYAFVGDDARSDALFASLRTSTEKMTAAERIQLDLLQGLVEGKILEVYRAARTLNALVPRDVVALWQHARYALWSNRPRECLEVLEGTGALDMILGERTVRFRQVSWYVSTAATAHHLLGEHEKELALARKGLELFPDLFPMHRNVAVALATIGRLEEMNRVLDSSLGVRQERGLSPAGVLLDTAEELRVHGRADEGRKVANRAVEWSAALPPEEGAKASRRSARVRALCLSERWDEARAVNAEFLAAYPESVDAIGYRGLLAARSGDRALADSASASLAQVRKRASLGGATFWRAAIAARLGDKDRAVALLREAFAQGVPIFVECHADWRLDPLRRYPPFEELLKPKE